jgi:hypothetical protein
MPELLINETNGQKFFLWTLEGYVTIQKIYVGYIRWVNYVNELEELQENYGKRLLICDTRLKLKQKIIEDLAEDREWVYQQREREQEEFSKVEKKHKVKIILFTSGGVLVGAAIGIIVGLVAG